MDNESISLISTLVNLVLAIVKLILGLAINSAALIAEAINSGLDIFSSFVTYLGIKAAKKPVDKEHPYGHGRCIKTLECVLLGRRPRTHVLPGIPWHH